VKWQKDIVGNWCNGNGWLIEPYFLRGGGMYRGGYLISQWSREVRVLGSWVVRGTAPTVAAAKALAQQRMEEAANRKALDILDGMKGGGA
jgi:hypothetical protein